MTRKILAMPMRDTLIEKLTDAFAPDVLEVIDESEAHRGHAGWREGGETHFRLRMVAAQFSGQGRVARQRAVNDVLREELRHNVHALAMELRAPDE
ncbi:MAG: BolA family protein [Pseudomonadota bacterium]